MDEQAGTVSIICVTHNETGNLPRWKASVDALRIPGALQVETILVDGGSDDGTESLARDLGFTHVLEHPGESIPACRNIGARSASGLLIGYVDADCEPAPDWLVKALPHLKSTSPSLLGWPSAPPEDRTWVQHAWHIHWSHKLRAAVEAEPENLVRNQAFRLLTTRNLIMNRDVFEAVGGFDESLATGEDTDFALRAARSGTNVCGLPSLRVLHHGEPRTLEQFYRQQYWHANRDAYGKILRERQGIQGLNALLFTFLFAASLLLSAAGFLSASVRLVYGLPLVLLIGGPALLVATRAKEPLQAVPLAILYFAYGLARAVELFRIHGKGKSWRNSPPP